MPYGQEGRQATVYQLLSDSGARALKVFKPRYCTPSLVSLADRLSPFASFSGLAVCQRTVLSPSRHQALLKDYPDLTYAVLMPWVEGPTWMEVVLEKRGVTQGQSLQLARNLAALLVGMEERGIAHCDLSAPNIILSYISPSSNDQHPLSLVDVEQMYGPGLDRPAALPGGSPGYAHSAAHDGLWQAHADRFAGAVLLAEMLGWCDERARDAAWGESFFEPSEMGRDCERARLLTAILSERWGERMASLFTRAWTSASLSEGPTFGEWLLAIPKQVVDSAGAAGGSHRDVSSLLLRAGQREVAGDLPGAVAAYQQVLQQLPEGNSLHQEVRLILARLQSALDHQMQLDEKADQAKKLEVAGRWREAVLLYEGLLAETVGSPGHRVAWEEGIKRCREEADLAGLFDTALKLREQRQEKAARELLVEVVRRRPDYEQRGGQKAAVLLTMGEVTGDQSRASSLSTARWSLLLAALAVLALLAGAGSLFQAQQASPQAGIATAEAAASEVTSISAEATRTAEGAAATSALAVEKRTAPASAQGTADARGTVEAVAAATKGAATGTALAQAAGATAGAAQAALQAQATRSAAMAQADKPGQAVGCSSGHGLGSAGC